MSIDPLIAAKAGQRGRLVTREELVGEVGASHRQIEGRMQRGILHPIHPGIYLFGGPAQDWLTRVRAALLACREGSMASHQTALRVLGLPSRGPSIHVTVCQPHSRKLDGVHVHRACNITDEDRAVVDGIACTALPRTMLDLARGAHGGEERKPPSPNALARLLEHAVIAHLFDLAAFHSLLGRNHGQPGTALLRDALALVGDSPPRSRSDFEDDVFSAIEEAGLPLPLRNVLIAGHEVDQYWPEFGLVVELDSRGFHDNPVAFERDGRRDQDLRDLGIVVERITWRQFSDDPARVVALIGRRLAALSPRLRMPAV